MEQRSARRIAYTETIHIELPDGTLVRAFARDLSRTGIAFLTTANLPLDAVSLTLPQESDDSPLVLRARVVRCSRLTDGFYEAAAAFCA